VQRLRNNPIRPAPTHRNTKKSKVNRRSALLGLHEARLDFDLLLGLPYMSIVGAGARSLDPWLSRGYAALAG
jgi:hypothetical protein